MKPRGPTAIVLLAFAAGAVALISGNLMSPGASPAVSSLMHTRLGNWVMQKWIEHDAPPAADGIRQIKRGDQRIDLTLPDVEGKPQQLAQWDGKRILLNFWATWCAPCRAEMPLLTDAQKRFAADGVQIVGIAVDQPAAVREWVAQNPPGYPILIDAPATHRATSTYGNTRAILPYSVLIGADGRMIRRKFGVFDADELAKWLEP